MKRFLDLAVSLPVFLASLPLMAAVGLMVYLKLGAPVLFFQDRIGLHGRPFKLVKFRSMREGAGPDAERLTPFGKWLRSTSLDELPTLWLVLKGTMSLVGPRPLLPEYLPHYTQEQARRHLVKPGLTGWAQVNGRNAQSWEERFAHDVWYVDHQSLALDLKILWMTLKTVLRREGINAEDHATMPNYVEYLKQKRQ